MLMHRRLRQHPSRWCHLQNTAGEADCHDCVNSFPYPSAVKSNEDRLLQNYSSNIRLNGILIKTLWVCRLDLSAKDRI